MPSQYKLFITRWEAWWSTRETRTGLETKAEDYILILDDNVLILISDKPSGYKHRRLLKFLDTASLNFVYTNVSSEYSETRSQEIIRPVSNKT